MLLMSVTNRIYTISYHAYTINHNTFIDNASEFGSGAIFVSCSQKGTYGMGLIGQFPGKPNALP